MATTPQQIIYSSLRSIGALASGENNNADPNAVNDAFYLLNEMLDLWSNEHGMAAFATQEVIHEITNSVYQDTIGQPGSSVGCTFTGSISGNVLTVTAITSGALSVGQILYSSTGTGTLTQGTAITSYGTGFGGNSTAAIGTYYINQNNVAGITSGTIVSYAPRPLRINSAFVRVVNSISGVLDYPVAILSATVLCVELRPACSEIANSTR